VVGHCLATRRRLLRFVSPPGAAVRLPAQDALVFASCQSPGFRSGP
jgi:hypothetical protein